MGLLQAAVVVCGFAALASAGTTYQTMDGVCFSQVFGRVIEFNNVKSSTQSRLFTLSSTPLVAQASLLFATVLIGSSGSGDSILHTSSGSPRGTPKYVWFSKQAISHGVKTIHADALGAPGFMGTSGADNSPRYLCGTTGHSRSSGDWRQADANFLTQYLKFYAQEGITISHVDFLNGPDFKTDYSNMQISSSAQGAIPFGPILSNIWWCRAVSVPTHGVVTVKLTTGGISSPTTTQRQATTARAATSRSGNGANCAALYGQCGGSCLTGPTYRASGSCKFSNDWYFQCL